MDQRELGCLWWRRIPSALRVCLRPFVGWHVCSRSILQVFACARTEDRQVKVIYAGGRRDLKSRLCLGALSLYDDGGSTGSYCICQNSASLKRHVESHCGKGFRYLSEVRSLIVSKSATSTLKTELLVFSDLRWSLFFSFLLYLESLIAYFKLFAFKCNLRCLGHGGCVFLYR